MTTHMTTVRLPDDLHVAMQKLQQRDGMPASEQMRRALREFLKKKGVYDPKKEKAR